MGLNLASPLPRINFEGMVTKLGEVDDLPTLPTIVQKLLKATEDETAGSRELMAILANDQSLSAKVLQVANSAFYGLRYRVTSVDNAISVIGFDEVKRIAMTAFVARSFPSRQNIAHFPLPQFWVHAIGTAHVARILCAGFSREEQDMAFSAGLLHDIGKLILCQYLPKHFFLDIHYAQTLKHEMVEVEKSVIGVDHGETGSILTTVWDLPPLYTKVLLHHHLRDYKLNQVAEVDRILAAVNLADTLVRRLQIGVSGNSRIPEYREDALDFLEHDSTSIQAVEAQVQSRRAQYEQLI